MKSISSRVAVFFLLTFGITWGLQLPGVLAQRGLLPGDPRGYLPLVLLGALPGEVAPLVAHAIVYGALGVFALRSFAVPLFPSRKTLLRQRTQ